MMGTEAWSGTTLRWSCLLLATLSAACTPAQEACLQVGSAVTEVGGMRSAGFDAEPEAYSVTIGGGPYMVTLDNNNLTEVLVTNPEDGPAWLFVDQPDMVLQLSTPDGVVDLAGAGVPNQSCPERIAESFFLEFPGIDDGTAYDLADLYFNPPVLSFDLWITLIPAE